MFGWILLGIILLIIIVYMIIGLYFHHVMFGKRFSKDPIVKYYDISMFEGLQSESIQFEYKNGLLKGFIYSYNQPLYKGIIVFSHGMFSTHQAYLQEIEYLAKNGYKVIGFDYFGVELSDGKNLKGLGSSLSCLDKVLFHVFKLFPKDKIFVMGHSWGGFASLCIAKYQRRLSGIVTMAPFIKASTLLKSMVPSYLYPAIPFFMLKDYLSNGPYIFENGLNVLKDSNIKTLILHSKDDHMVKYYKNTYILKELVKKDNVIFIIQNDKKHNPSYSLEAINYTDEVNKVLLSLPKDKKDDYRKSLDYQLMGKLDETIMNKIIDFFDEVAHEE